MVCQHAAANFSTVLKLKTSMSDLKWKKVKSLFWVKSAKKYQKVFFSVNC